MGLPVYKHDQAHHLIRHIPRKRYWPDVYYCPKCSRRIPKERVEQADRELRTRFGVAKLSDLRCPVCDCEYIDLDKVKEGGERYALERRKEADTP